MLAGSSRPPGLVVLPRRECCVCVITLGPGVPTAPSRGSIPACSSLGQDRAASICRCPRFRPSARRIPSRIQRRSRFSLLVVRHSGLGASRVRSDRFRSLMVESPLGTRKLLANRCRCYRPNETGEREEADGEEEISCYFRLVEPVTLLSIR